MIEASSIIGGGIFSITNEGSWYLIEFVILIEKNVHKHVRKYNKYQKRDDHEEQTHSLINKVQFRRSSSTSQAEELQ